MGYNGTMIEIESSNSDKEGLTPDEILFAKKHDLTHDEMLGYIHDMEKESELIRQSTIEAMEKTDPQAIYPAW
jgi:hypothetical protein|tara:strand:- start:41 stop:259 length:219 start_codon:yes stop_codon:yes gene_type:complete